MATNRVARNSVQATNTAAATEVWSERAAENLGALLKPYLLEGEAMPDVVLLQNLVGRLLKDHDRESHARQSEHFQDNISAITLRVRRDEAAKELREVLRQARYFLDQAVGPGEGRRTGIGKGLSYMSPQQLFSAGTTVVAALRAYAKQGLGSLTLPEPEALAAEVERRVERLEEALAELRPKRIRRQISREEERKQAEATEKLTRRAAGFLAGLYKLCDLDHFAKNVRPSFRRRAKLRKKGEHIEPIPLALASAPEEEIVAFEPREEDELLAGPYFELWPVKKVDG